MECQTGAEFSECRTWRYALWREWGGGNSLLVTFIGLNPSTADENVDDPTIRKCIGYAKRWGYGGVRMLNLFAFRATYPLDMKLARDPVGPDNDQALLRYLSDPRNRLTVAAWGKDGKHQSRGWLVKKMLGDFKLKCLGTNGDGTPRHPLYLPNDVELVDF